jgi:hypothetical protein
MGLVKDLIDWIIINNLAQEYGVDIFDGYIPDNTSSVITLREYDSYSSPIKRVDVHQRFIQVVIRDLNADKAQQECVKLHKLFLQLPDENADNEDDNFTLLPSGRWVILCPKNLPIKISVDERHRTIYGFNTIVTTNSD